MSTDVLQNTVSELSPKSGLERKSRQEVSEYLARSLADSYMLFVNTQVLHWNVQGPLFYSIHKLTEEQYEDLFEAIDDIAERIRALGFPAPHSIENYQELSALTSLPKDGSVKELIEHLTKANETCAARMREAIRVAEDADDVKTADLLTDRVGQHEENAWMLLAITADE